MAPRAKTVSTSTEPPVDTNSTNRQAPTGRRTSRASGRAANGAGSVVVRPLAGGRVAYDVFWTYLDADGARRLGVARGFRSAREAEKHRRSVTAVVDTGRHVPPQDMTVAQYLTDWLDGLRLKPQTVRGYRRKIRLQVLPHIGHLPLDQVRATHLNRLYRQLEQRGGAKGQPLSSCTVREVHNILSSAYTDAVKADLVPDAPTRRADPPTEREAKARRTEMTAWTAGQLRTFLRANRGDHYYSIWHLAAATGLRRGEILGLVPGRSSMEEPGAPGREPGVAGSITSC